MHKIIGAALALATTVCLTAGTISSAHAEKVVHRDARGDVLKVHWNDSEDDALTPAPNAQDSDIIRTVVDHRHDNLFVTMVFRDLRGSSALQAFGIAVLTDDNLRRDVFVSRDRRTGAQGEKEMTTRAGTTVKCPRLAIRIDYTAKAVRFRVPRSCLGNPRWVRVGAASIRIVNSTETFYLDDAILTGKYRDAGPAYGARVHRG
ncbi:hypothetical protein ASD66_10385 [Nocardioides sp. Root151]|nr:hypothetical protein ASD66_10385 [Nocardioides sp. Root151]